MINPILPFGIKGAIWYQGENNWNNGYQYRTLLPTMITDWRTHWNEGNFPFLIIQIAGTIQQDPYSGEDGSSNVRESEFLTAKNTPNCGIVTAVDLGKASDIHPKDKADVASRLTALAEATVYHKKIIHSGPTYKSMTIQGNAIRIDFDNVYGGLVQMTPPSVDANNDISGKPLLPGTTDNSSLYSQINGFLIAGDDHKWYKADAKIVDKYSILVSSPNVASPVAVRYGWSGWLPLDLYNNAGLPVFPFRTDNWKLWSQP
jgi:sialate O-acetylesterase